MYAAISAAREGRSVLLLDKGLVGRGGATIMAQMTVAAAIAHEEPDDWTLHLEDTLEAGRGLCHEPLSAMLCACAGADPRHGSLGHAVGARGRPYQTGDGAGTPPQALLLRRFPEYQPRCRRYAPAPGGQHRTDPTAEQCRRDRGLRRRRSRSRCGGARSVDWIADDHRRPRRGPRRRRPDEDLRRSSASTNMGGEACWLALEAGAELVDMEFVQFFPIAHLAPRLVGMDPIMWDPFRYKLGGRLLNGSFEEFIHRYGGEDEVAIPRRATWPLRHSQRGRGRTGSPHGGVLDFRHIPEDQLRSAFGPVIDRLLGNGIDLTRVPVEVAPTAHYHMGGIAVDERLETRVEGLFAAGEAVGGAGGR